MNSSRYLMGRWKRFAADAWAVSSVVGTVLMLGITVSVFAGLSLVILDRVAEEPGAPHADLRVYEGGGSVLVQHRRGESLDLDRGTLLVDVDGAREVVPLTDLSASLGGSWDIGESICVTCMYPGQEILAVAFVYDNFLLLDEIVGGAP